MSLRRRRIQRAEQELDPAAQACPTCNASDHVHGILVVPLEQIRYGPDGRISTPAACPECGRRPAVILPANHTGVGK
jgi:transcription elongation factor Elf1